MAYAKKCDRCKKYFDNNKTKSRTLPDNYTLIKVETLAKGRTTDEEFDLCDECWQDFFNFIDNK